MDSEFKASIVKLIVEYSAEEAIKLLAEHYHVHVPTIRVGLPKHPRKNSAGCYSAKTQTIHVLNRDSFKDPYVILHEFYHHLRTSIDKKHKGTEKHANEFAKEFLKAYKFGTLNK